MKQWLKEFVHNCVVHPMMPFLPVKLASALHKANGYWAFGLNRLDEVKLEGLTVRTFDESKIARPLIGKDLLKLIGETENKEKQDVSLARFLQKKAEHQAKRKWLDEQPPILIKAVKEGENREDVPVSVPAPIFSERLEAALITIAWGGCSGVRARLTLMHPDTNIDPANCAKEAATFIYYVLDTVAWTVPPQVIEQIEQRLSASRSFE